MTPWTAKRLAVNYAATLGLCGVVALGWWWPYLDLTDAVSAVAFFLEGDGFDGRVYNVVTVNATVRQVVEVIGAFVPDLEVGFVDERIMNQLSYEVLNTRLGEAGFAPAGDLEKGVGETIALLRRANAA